MPNGLRPAQHILLRYPSRSIPPACPRCFLGIGCIIPVYFRDAVLAVATLCLTNLLRDNHIIMQNGIDLNILMLAFVIPCAACRAFMPKATFLCQAPGSKILRMND